MGEPCCESCDTGAGSPSFTSACVVVWAELVRTSITFHQLVATWLWDVAFSVLLCALPPSFSQWSKCCAVSQPKGCSLVMNLLVRCQRNALPPTPEPWRDESDGPACCICMEMRAGCTLGTC